MTTQSRLAACLTFLLLALAPLSGAWAATLAAGGDHTCAITSQGEVMCWGSNEYGQLGDGTTTERRTPVKVEGIQNATSVAASRYNTCALIKNGTAKCWGENGLGQLGDGATTDSARPVEVKGLDGVIAIAVGRYSACAIINKGEVACWGADLAGKLGGSSLPAQVAGLENVVDLTMGKHHACAVKSNGEVACWGNNQLGQLGDGTTTNRSTPVSVSGIDKAVAVAAGGFSACAVLSDGKVMCWGSAKLFVDSYARMTDASLKPILIPGIGKATAIATSGDHYCALLKSQRQIVCWGENTHGQLGRGTVHSDYYWRGERERLLASPFLAANLGQTVDVAQTTVIAVGRRHSCAAVVAGKIFCWGSNQYGQVGNGAPASEPLPAATVVGIKDAKLIVTGDNFSCTLTSLGRVKCWGANDQGQLGNGTFFQELVPVEVLGIQNAQSISAKGRYVCALLETNTVECWGDNHYGQLGDDTKTSRSVPTAVQGLGDVLDVATGRNVVCAILSDRTVRCWSSYWGDKYRLYSIPRITDAKSISVFGNGRACVLSEAGEMSCSDYNELTKPFLPKDYHKAKPEEWQEKASNERLRIVSTMADCALMSDGTLRCGKLTYGGGGEGKAIAVSGSIGLSNSGCVIIHSGEVRCWGALGKSLGKKQGRNAFGFIVPNVTGAVAIDNSVSTAFGCAVVKDGTVKCWGNNADGQLGNGKASYYATPQQVVGTPFIDSVTAPDAFLGADSASTTQFPDSLATSPAVQQ